MHVFTGDVSSAGTNSNVFICLYGELGDTGERKLEKSETHMDKFERNNVRIAFFLTYIQKNGLLYCGYSFCSSWKKYEDAFVHLVLCVISKWTNGIRL